MTTTKIPRWTSWTAAFVGAVALAGCGASDSQSPLPPGVLRLAPGETAPLTTSSTLKIEAGSTGSENVLVLVDTSTEANAGKIPYQLSAAGVGSAGTVSPPATSRSPLDVSVAATGASPSAPTLDLGFGMRLNERSRSRLLGGFGAARRVLASRAIATPGLSRSLATSGVQVGDIVTVNVSSSACDNIQQRGARVEAIGAQSIVLSDTLNPSGGFTSTDFQKFAARFDTLVYPLDVANFGTPADIDQNQKVILLFTSAVNALTPRSSTSYVGGFFYDRDLFPVLQTPDFQGCAGSNYAELFYLLAPDPTGTVNGNVRTTGFVDSLTTSVIAHEFQHLINASRRLYVTPNVQDFEVGWLNEGLSHIAEELLFYHESGLTPGGNIAVGTLQGSAKRVSAFNADQASNTARYDLFLEKPSDNSPFRNDDSLETRGATWNLLRYLADRKSPGASQASVWQALVNTTQTGVGNLSAVFGSDLPAKVRDWSISLYADDYVSAVPAELTQPSWNYRSIFPALSGANGTYPLKVNLLSTTGTSATASGSLIGGSSAFYRFSIPAGSTAELTLTLTTSGPIAARVIRMR
jgi:hypothetical protein